MSNDGRKSISDQVSKQDFFQQHMAEIKALAGAEEDFYEVQFTEEMCNFLLDEAVVNNYESSFFKKTKQGIRVDAWDFNKDRKELSLFITEYSQSLEMRTISNSEVEKLFKRAIRFFEKSKNPDYFLDEIDDTTDIYGIVRNISENIDNIEKIQFFLLTNASLSDRFKSFTPIPIEGYKTTFDIWDINRRTRIYNSGRVKEDIVIDFTKYEDGGIKFLPAFKNKSSCNSYLLVFPGELVSDIYDKYGDRLLEQNVRTFLQFRGGVNKGIRNTLKNQPEMFFAYNNGLTVTAEELEIDNEKILKAKNLQVVNGGQTTASIFMSKLNDKKNIDLTNVSVQVKLSVIDEDKVDEIVPTISKASNTQNKVSAADFFSNHPFHKTIEDFSRRILAPASEEQLSETYWFYERARGQYANKQNKLTPAEKRKFLALNPRAQMFTKTDLAKYANIFNNMPDNVSKGAQWNFGKFAEEITGKDDSNKGLWDKNELAFNELWYKELIAKAIIFKYLDKRIMKQVWYSGYKANIVAYTLSKFSYEVRKAGKFINFPYIWQSQNISESLGEELVSLSETINYLITDTDENVTQFCKKATCWDFVKQSRYNLPDNIKNDLIDGELHTEQKIDAKKKQKVLSGINLQVEVVNKGQEYWTQVYDFCNNLNLLSDKELSILSTTLRLNTNPPSEKQCRIILQVEERALEEGFYFVEI